MFGGSSSSGGSRSTSSTVYEPDKVRIAEIEQNTKIRLATMERERQELMHKAQLEFLQAHYDCEEALVQAKVKGFAATAEMIIRCHSPSVSRNHRIRSKSPRWRQGYAFQAS